jgi:hypothetical protein
MYALHRLFIGDRHIEAVTDIDQLRLVQLLLLMRKVARLTGVAHAETLNGLGQNHRGPPVGLRGFQVGVVNLLRIMTAAAQMPQFVVAHVLHQFQQLRILPEELLPNVGAALGLKVLELAVHALFHALHQ